MDDPERLAVQLAALFRKWVPVAFRMSKPTKEHMMNDQIDALARARCSSDILSLDQQICRLCFVVASEGIAADVLSCCHGGRSGLFWESLCPVLRLFEGEVGVAVDHVVCPVVFAFFLEALPGGENGLADPHR